MVIFSEIMLNLAFNQLQKNKPIAILAFQAYILIQTKYVKVYLSIKQSEFDMKAKLLNEHLELLKSAHKVPEAKKDTNTPEETH